MARVAVDVVIKPEILDPQGKAILAALARTGHPGVSSVRQGKHFDLEVDDSVSATTTWRRSPARCWPTR